MPAPRFRPTEIQFLRSQLTEWQRMKAVPVSKSNVDSLLRERRQFIREVCMQLMARFPDRDPSVSDPSHLTYSAEDLERLPEILRQWFRNNSRHPVDLQTKERSTTKSRTHARNIAAKRYSQQIKEIARELREADKDLKPMTAFNKATTLYLAELKEDDPEAYAKLYDDAREIRGASLRDYTDLTPDVLESLLDKFPKRLLSDLEQYGRELPVHIWCIAAFAKPSDHELEAFTLSTPSLDGMNDSAFDKSSRQAFLGWMREHLGMTSYFPF
ncbi:hypothetical protein RSAG8_07191, partial [Rhizoctonia solani AG-8 WAC10335]